MILSRKTYTRPDLDGDIEITVTWDDVETQIGISVVRGVHSAAFLIGLTDLRALIEMLRAAECDSPPF
ncbi:hypothetical protein [Kitasatospora cineracea]|uniref:hypothetical protein n=1 Tax=Kitasatospora cineracea TaxID=88074 RepID=UPI00380DF9F0